MNICKILEGSFMKSVLIIITISVFTLLSSVNFLTAANNHNYLNDKQTNNVTAFSLENIDFKDLYLSCLYRLNICLEKYSNILNSDFNLGLIDFRNLCSESNLNSNFDIIYFHNFDLSKMNFDKDNISKTISNNENSGNSSSSGNFKSYIINIKPNPAGNYAALLFNLESSGYLTIRLFSEIAKCYPIVVDELYQKGINSINLNLTDIQNGVYVIQIIIGNEIFSEKLIVAK
jgi:hypothetical protein